MKKTLIRLGVFAAIFITLFVVLKKMGVDYSGIDIVRIKESVTAYGVWAPLVYILFFQIRPFILFPATGATLLAGVIWGWEGLIYIMVAYVVCATWQFFIARYIAPEMVENIVGKKAERVEKYIEKNSLISVVIIRLVPNIAWDVQNIIIGLTKIKYWKYILGTIIGMLPGSIALVYFGDSFVSVLSNPQHWWKMAVALVLLVGVYFLVNNLIKEKI